MELIIHRGSKEIGGSCVELKSKNTRILIDIGLPLNSKEDLEGETGELKRQGILLNLQGLYKDENPSFAAVLLSHSHPDHYGLLPHINHKIPVYASKGSIEIIKLSGYFNGKTFDDQILRPLTAGKKITIGDFSITSFLVDHSAFDAMAFLVEADGKRIFYSGDFRGHGKKGTLFENICRKPPADIDYLLLEGTSLSRESVETKTEKDVENALVDVFQEKASLIFMACSSQNIDRIVSVYRACLRTDSVFVIDPYTAFILSRLKHLSPRLPQYDWGKNIRIFFAPNSFTRKMANDGILFHFRSAKIGFDEILSNKNRMVIKDSYLVRKIFASKKRLPGARLVFSMWPGYLEEIKPFWDSHNVPVVHIHTSGHATPSDLKRFVKALNPKAVIPIHTICPQDYQKHFDAKIKTLGDGQIFSI